MDTLPPIPPARHQMQRRAPRWRSPAAAWSLVFAAVLVGAVFATDLPGSGHTAAQVRATVQSQLQAFAADDAGRAYALADPGVRSKYPSPQAFLDMVRDEYPMVHRPAAITFLEPETDGDLAFQKVRITDAGGSAWLVTYLLNRQQDDAWLISACLVIPDGARVTA